MSMADLRFRLILNANLKGHFEKFKIFFGTTKFKIFFLETVFYLSWCLQPVAILATVDCSQSSSVATFSTV